jgi:hypothetical protein
MTIPLDQARIDAFGQKMVETLNHAGLALMISIGHRNGLFEVLSRLPAATSEQIAVEAGQNERYARVVGRYGDRGRRRISSRRSNLSPAGGTCLMADPCVEPEQRDGRCNGSPYSGMSKITYWMSAAVAAGQ